MNLAEYRKKPQRLADFLPWAALVDEGIVLNKDGSFQRTAQFRGPDLDSAMPAELVGTPARLNNALRRLGSGWAIFVEAQPRSRPATIRDSHFPDAVSALVDVERRAQFEQEGAHFECCLLPDLRLSAAGGRRRPSRALALRGPIARRCRRHAKSCTALSIAPTGCSQLVEGFMPEVSWLDDEETLTYLHASVSTKRHRVRVPEIPMYLDALLADQPLTGGLEPRLGQRHLRVADHRRVPDRDLSGDSGRAQPARLSLSLVDPGDHARQDRRDKAADQNPPAMVRQAQIDRRDPEGGDDQRGLHAARHRRRTTRRWMPTRRLQELGSDAIGEAYVTATVTVWDDDAARRRRKAPAGRESHPGPRLHLHRRDASMRSKPGSAPCPATLYANVRQPPVSTLNLAHMIPLSAVWAGPERDEHFGAPPLFFARTEGSTPVPLFASCGRCRPYAGRGADRRRQVVLLALMALQFRRYAGAQVFAFDFGGSIRAAALAMGGDWHDLGGALSEDAERARRPAAAGRIDEYRGTRLGGGMDRRYPCPRRRRRSRRTPRSTSGRLSPRLPRRRPRSAR